jgi:hypothetical protein
MIMYFTRAHLEIKAMSGPSPIWCINILSSFRVFKYIYMQCSLSNPAYQGTSEMSEYSGFILGNRNTFEWLLK